MWRELAIIRWQKEFAGQGFYLPTENSEGICRRHFAWTAGRAF
ncbi:MAG: hypothetical protein NZ899_07725 [Thermoguttaceae bacterium]|nr:hypothetical protein [Thermoguttaceae bacterium]MDW8079030.1 hypothetical protein [Thermoguttaceae bacterium]